ncbi:MAG TPA: mycofactocin biosynthesis glycosyltransferase MftF [Streptosporangiaceae bacterium]|nr:mycofactocin biosynthesis glycosyltransferase MftF [Streptosporangiaceae bacterium]
MTRPAAGPRPGPAPLPAGFSIVFDPQTQFVGADVLFGGSPPRLLRLNPAGQRALDELRRGPVCSPAAGKLARRLTDTGMAHPRPPRRAGPGGHLPTAPAGGTSPGAPGPRDRWLGADPPSPHSPSPADAPADVTVVIPARDRPAYLDRCLTALGRNYPVIVVDDGSRQAAELAGLCRRHGATLIRRPASGGPGPARNDGLAQVTTPLVAFLDSDCETGPEWITALAQHFADPLVAAVAPRVRPVPGAGPAGRYLEARAPLDMGAREGRVLPLTRLSYVPTAALLVRRAALAADDAGPFDAGLVDTGPVDTGPFDPSLRYGEDVDLVWRLAEAGWRVRYDPAASVSHAEPVSWTRLLARRFRYGCSAAPLAQRHPGQVPPLILQAWPAAAVTALLARRPVLALAAYGAGTGQLVRLLRGWDVPPKGVLGPMADSVLQTWLGAGRWTIQYALPVAAASLARPGGRTARTRLGRRVAVASLLVGPPIAEWRRIRPSMHAAAFSLGYLADEMAYGAGVYRGAMAERLLSPLLPAVAWRPLSKAPAASRPGVTPGRDHPS